MNVVRLAMQTLVRMILSGKVFFCLKMSGIQSIHDLAHADPYILKQRFGVMDLQLYACAWGIDRSFLGEKKQTPKEKSLGNSQALPNDYARREQIELVLKELAD